MATELERARDWARKMATVQGDPLKATPLSTQAGPNWAYPTESERVLWAKIADEIDTFITDRDIADQMLL